MFAAGPAPMATRRFHVGAFQYASEPSASRSSVIPFSAEARAAGETVCELQRILEVVDGVLRVDEVVVASSDRLTRSTGPASVGASSTAREKPPLGVVRNRPVHPGNRHEAAERDHADAVLDPVPRPSSRSQAGSRCRTVAGAARPRATRRSDRPRGRG